MLRYGVPRVAVPQTLIHCALLVLVCPASVHAQQVVDSSAAASKKVYVAFRMENWTSKHIHDAKQATEHAELLKKMGCEVKTAQHNGHTDVTARTVFWKVLELGSQDKVHGWVTWFQKSGFETIHAYKAGTIKEKKTEDGKQREVVQYRLNDWKSQHTHEAEKTSQLIALMRGMGCEVESASHNGHTDVKMRCLEWMEIELDSHDAAHSWQAFLKEMGFEVKHEH